ncbi:MAG: SDR family NAD(P)-dependent oxidoreductase, partial [Chloroflexota bacterium]
MNVLITGANRGIGLAFVRQYAAMGATVFAACRNPDAATDLWHLWEKHTEHLYIVQMNVTDADSIGAAQAIVSAQTKQLNRL